MEAPISASQGAMRFLPGKLESLLSEPSMYGLHKGEKSKIRLLKGELQELIDKYLMEPSEVESPALTAICWAKEVREMSYDINDFVDELVDAAAGAKIGIGVVKKTPHFKISRFREKLKIRQGIAGEISGFRARVKEAIHRHKSYLGNCKWRPRRDERPPPPLYGEAGRLRLVGMDKSSVGELYGWLTNDGQPERKVASIVGVAGVGKTTLANELYRKLGGQFQCRAFVRTSPRPGMKRILSSIFAQVRRHQPPKAWEMNNLVAEINAYLKDKTISTTSESSSHLQNPVAEHETVTRAMEGGMVSASTGAMDSVLRKLTVLIVDDYLNLRGKQEEVMFLKKELDAMNAVLEHLADMPTPNMEMKRMRNQMKEITYEVEDWIDDLMLKFDEHLHETTTRYPDKRGALQDFIDQIRNLTGTAQAGKPELSSTVHMSEIQTLLPSYSGLHTLYNKAIGLVGIDGPRDEVVKRMNAGKHKRQVACILGSGGLGKTTLATEVYNHIKGLFEWRVFIRVPWKIDIARLHKNILWQLHFQQEATYDQDMDEADHINAIRRYLRDKRYLIVIDGVWSAQTWEVLKSALPMNKRGSRILMTTDDTDIAESCEKHSFGFIYGMEPLNAQDSIRLFRGLLFGSERSCPMELEKVAEKILAACGGIPMAISIMAGILAGIPAEVVEWEMVEKRIEPVAGDGDVSKEIIRKMFHISYAGLPRDIKSCLLYLSIFPENQFIRKDRVIWRWGIFPKNQFIRKDRLIWRWIAEGFLPKRSRNGESSWETGERYFLELIARNLIEPVYEDEKDDYEVPVGCKVHGLILEFITSLSNEENLVTTIGEATHVQHDVIHRLSASYMNQEKEDHIWRLISTQRLSKVRSITILGRDIRVDAPSLAMGVTLDEDQRVASPLLPWGPLLLGSRFLRVLDLEDAKSLQDQHLEGTIEGLVLLRYLGLPGTGISELPEQIGKVEQLETLDLRRNHSLRTLPASISSLRKLARLLVDPWVHLPSEISKMQELEQVSTIDADSRNSLNSVADLLVKSKLLRILDVNFGTLYGHDGEMTEICRESIMSFLRVVGNSNLHSLSLCSRSKDRDDYVLGILLDSWEVPPRHLRRFKLKFSLSGVIPPRMASLVSVTHLDITISELEAGGVRVLGDLPNLVLLKLTAQSSTRWVISGEKAFRCLKVFTFPCFFPGGMGLEFTPGAMPQLQRLRLRFSARKTLSLYGGFDFGIQHLSCLTRVHATIHCFDATVSEVEAAEAAIRKQVSKFPIKPTTEFSRVYEDRMREDEGTMKTSLKQKAKMMFSL